MTLEERAEHIARTIEEGYVVTRPDGSQVMGDEVAFVLEQLREAVKEQAGQPD